MNIEKFWHRVDKIESGCWEWTGTINNKGYGMFYVNPIDHKKLAHRVSYEIHHGVLSRKDWVLHRCDNPKCVNPEHLFLGDCQANVDDMMRKGRNGQGKNPVRGSHIGTSKFTDDTILAVRRAYIDGMSRKDMAAQFGLSIQYLDDITSGKSWAHLLGKDGHPSLEDLRTAKRRTPSAKLTAEQVADVKRRLAAGEQGKAIAELYGIHKASVSDIKTGKNWR